MSEGIFCYHHWMMEQCPDDAYRVCGECQHVYRSPEDLLDVFNTATERAERGAPDLVNPEVIYFCPLCLHDF